MIRNTQSILCLITLCFNIMLINHIVYGLSSIPNCNICNNDIYIQYPNNQINVSFLNFDDMVHDIISCQQLYDAGNTHFINIEQCTLIHNHENGIQLQTFCGCSSVVSSLSLTSIESSSLTSSLSQLKVLQLIKEPEMKIMDIESMTTTDNVTIIDGNMTDNITQNIEAYENITVGKPVVVDKPTKRKEPKRPVVASAPVSSSGGGGGKLKSPPVLKPSKLDATVGMPTAPVMIASGPVLKKSSPTASQQSMSTSSKPNVVLKPTIKIKDVKGGNVAPV